MRLSLGLLVVGSVALVACSGADNAGGIRRADGPGTNGGETPVDPPGTTTPTAASCPATVPVALPISTTDTAATDLHIVLGAAIYRNGQTVHRVDGKGARSELYTSADSVHSFADDSVLVAIESPNPPYAVLKIMPVGATSDTPPPGADTKGGPAVTTTPAGWNAAGSYVFGSDATSLYFMADVDNVGDTLYRVDKANPALMTVVAHIDGAILSDPQLAGNDVWFVRDQKRVYKAAITPGGEKDPTGPIGLPNGGTAAEPVEVFSLGYADCKLAVGGMHAFCSTGKAIEQRDLSGANLVTVLDAQKGTAPSPLGAATYGNDMLYVRTLPASATDVLKNGIRAVKAGATSTDEKLVACGREAITSIASDATWVVWTEQGKGVFAVPR